MKIRFKLYSSAFTSIFLMMIIVIAVVLAISNVQDENQNRDLAEGVLQGVSELGILTTEYLLLREDSTERAWNTKYNAIAKILVRADKNQTESMRLDFIFLSDAFLQVTRNYKRTLTLRSRYAPQEEIDSTILLEQNMVSELLTRQQSIITEASALSDQATGDAKTSLEFAIKTVVLLLTLLAVVIMATSILVVRSIAKPLDELTKGTEIIGGGDLEYRTGITTRDEIGSLSRAFDQMTERLSTTTVSRDKLADEVERRQRAERQLRDLFTELENKNTELERFTYTASHDLKSPLITIKGFLGALEEDIATGNTKLIQADMARISASADPMSNLLDELLELSRIGRVVGPPEEIALEELVKACLALLAGPLEARQVQVTVAEGLPVVFGDRMRIGEVLQNMIENAVKFMGEEPHPRLDIGGLEKDGESVCFVRDNGIGIDPRYNQKVFELFDKLNRNTEGSGIGLALVKRIIEVHGGRVWVESEGYGHGSTFYFALPSKLTALRDEVVQNAR